MATETERLEAVITLKDELTEKLEKIAEKTMELKKKAEKLEPVIKLKDKVSSNMNKINASVSKISKTKHYIKLMVKGNADKDIKKVLKEFLKLKAQKAVISIKDKASKVVGAIGSKLAAIIKKRWDARIGVKDRASGTLSKIKGLLAVLGAGVVIKATLQKGAELEQQLVSMNHFMGVGNPKKSKPEVSKMTKEYVNMLRKNANATPYETGEVMTAGTRALTISGGNVGQSMRLVKLAEDMAAADPNKTLGDAIEAIADAQMGEFERMKEFGFKGSKEAFDKAGGDFFKMKDQGSGRTVNDTFGGLAQKQAGTSAGVFSTIMGNVGTIQQNLGTGILDGMKPALVKVKDLIEKAFGNDESQNKFIEAGKRIGEVLGKIVDFAIEIGPKIRDAFKNIVEGLHIDEIRQAFQPGIDGMKQLSDSMGGGGAIITTVFKGMGIIISGVLQMIGHIFSILVTIFSDGAKIIGAAIEGVKSVAQSLAKKWQSVKSSISSAVRGIGSIVRGVFSGIKGAIDSAKRAIQRMGDAWQNLKSKIEKNPIVQTIKNVVEGGGGGGGGNKPKPKKPNKPKAFGQRRIPYNGYRAELHEGERILTKNEANRLDSKGTGGVTVIIENMNVREEADIDKIVNKLVKKINVATAGGV